MGSESVNNVIKGYMERSLLVRIEVFWSLFAEVDVGSATFVLKDS